LGGGVTRLPGWAAWSPNGAEPPWSVGIEEEVMLLDPRTWALAPRIDEVLPALSEPVAELAGAETHGSAIEIASRPHRSALAAAGELQHLRGLLAADLAGFGIRAAVAGTHPFAEWTDTTVSGGPRYQSIYETMRALARREPTFALHVHVAVPTAEAAMDALRGLRAHLPVLLALSANSPFWQGRDTGLASARTPIFSMFPRTGLPRPFASYAEYVEAIDVLVRCDAIPEPTFLWWDARLQPRLGTLEVRVMDAQTRAWDTAALAALVQCVVRLEATEGFAGPRGSETWEAADENRFLASRDGVRAELIDVQAGRRRPFADVLDELLAACAPHARDLGCEAGLAGVRAIVTDSGDERQRRQVGVDPGVQVGAELGPLVEALAAEFTATRPERAALQHA
jgi:glutamate---cysteine ligase / carboxylate-amine ligase